MFATHRFIAYFFSLVVLVLSSTISVSADPITISITNQSFQTTPGATVVLSGTLTNTTASILFVNSSGGLVNFMNQPPNANIVLDATFFIRPNLTTFVLQPGQSTGVVPFVSLLINPAAPDPSLTSGTIEFCGGAGPLACDQLGAASYTLLVSTSPTPEPTTMLLLGTGLASMATGAHGRRRRNKRS
jgi:hypothetical protein